MSNQIVGSPDWQRGVVTSQKLLSTQAATSLTATVFLPPNAETLVIVTSGPIGGAQTLTITGVTSAQVYPWQIQFIFSGGQAYAYYYADVSSSVDSSVTITFAQAAAFSWYVYSDQAAHVSFDPNLGLVVQEQNIGPSGWGIPAMGYDGTNMHFVETDTTGKLVISNPGGGATTQPLNAPLVANGVLAIGSDGTDGRVISTDVNGNQIPLVPTVSVQSIGPAGGYTIINTPISGHWYLFGAELSNNTAAQSTVSILAGGNYLATANVAAMSTVTVDLNGFKTPYQVQVDATASYSVTLRYCPGP